RAPAGGWQGQSRSSAWRHPNSAFPNFAATHRSGASDLLLSGGLRVSVRPSHPSELPMAARFSWTHAASVLAIAVATTSPCLAADEVFQDGFEPSTHTASNDAEAARFLTQATFGPTLAGIAHVREIGYEAWIDEQLAEPAMYLVPYLKYIDGLGEP